MNKKISVGATIAVAALAVAITFCVTVNFMTDRFERQLGALENLRRTYEKTQELDDVIAQNAYFTITDIQRDDNIGRAYASALREAGDRYAYYYTAEEYTARETENAGGGAGFGISVKPTAEDEMKVYNVLRGSPADSAGLRPGDIILSVGDAEADGFNALADALDGAEGTVKLTVRRGEEKKEFSVSPGDYTVTSVYAERVGGIAVVRITAFHADTDEQFISLINELSQDASVTGLVFDLRQNGGGLLTSVVNMLDRLLPAGVVVTEKDKNGKEIDRFSSDATSLDLPMAVLVDKGTASASELFACAMRDYDKAKLVGEETYGKGCVQTTHPFSDGSALTFTTALYYPPASDNFDGKPLKPDEEVLLSEEQKENFYSLTPENDPQLIAALDLLSSPAAN